MDAPAYGGGLSASIIHPAVLIAMIIAIILILILPRKWIIVPLLVMTFLSPWGQQIYILGVHLFVPRILILVGLARVVFVNRNSPQSRFAGGLNPLDTVFFLWLLFRAATFIILFKGDSGAFIYEGGFVWDVLGGYLLLRILIQNEEDIVRAVKVFAVIVFVCSLTMLNERLRAQNVFGYFGTLSIVPDTREGAIRAQGPFAHPILAGVFGVTLVPLFWWLWQGGKSKVLAAFGFIGSTLMMISCASSTPLFAYLAAFVGLAFWPLRNRMRIFRWGIVLCLIALHMVMKAPVWFLIGRVDLIAGNSGYHRAELIDQCIRHFSDWWLIGTTASGTWGFDMWDLSNQFVAEAETGGLLTFICFVLIISRAFSRIGKSRKIAENQGDSKQEWFMWFLGIALFTHIVGYFGISYFDNVKIYWCAFLAIVAAATAPILATQKAKEELPEYVTPLKSNVRSRRLADVGGVTSSVGTFRSR
jgi:hypothetical protein